MHVLYECWLLFQVVGDKYSVCNVEGGATYELIDQLLNQVSPAYRESFGAALCNKLEKLSQSSNS